uniref:Glucokinase n=1 Tax=Candidatus Kentrum sp. DK TaxID=2126562 RepID=A0A450RWH7_9GAMM|nr:MAG: glucokinase [Candidatus Kentron sp. DK]
MKEDVILGFDVGGTNSRAVVARSGKDGLDPHPDFPPIVREKVASKAQLRAFIQNILASPVLTDAPIARAVIALAGPVIRGSAVTMSNWSGEKEIALHEFEDWGLPDGGRTILLNDMEAGCYGLAEHLNKPGPNRISVERLTDAPGVGGGNRIFIAPGTGLGAAAIIAAKSPSGVSPVPIAAELQHAPMPILSAEEALVARWLRREKDILHPSWDDMVSGRGLVHAYWALYAKTPAGLPGVTPNQGEDFAAAIARQGVAKDNVVAEHALGFFYTCLGRFCQLMALGFQPFGGIFIGGASTTHNRDFIKNGLFIKAFLNNQAQQSLLGKFPIYLVGKGDLNPDGALWLGHFSNRALPTHEFS